MAIAYVQSAKGINNGFGTELASDTALAVTTGNAIVVATGNYHATSVPAVSTITDTAGNTYTLAAQGLDAVNDCGTELWIAKNITGHAANVVTVTWAASCQYRTVLVAEYSGVHLTTPQDTDYAPAVGTDATSPYTSGSDSTTENNELIIGSFYDYATSVDAYASSDPSVLRITSGAAGLYHALADCAAATAGAFTVAVASTGTDRAHLCLAIAIKQVAVSSPLILGMGNKEGHKVRGSRKQ